ncbi:PilW family protein [Tolumonas osonensis]|uniref:Type IV pilus assembly protein PilW n=1 Tax=Tolumonas osonensis TaxID=675874 RepID=A0A841GQD5_9GAMM|nr:PilW family protein [Tolumonas osonensis]MBB6056772.1 type IV pilus assembly protein PilW [Tolumonas osonensis]
MSRNNNHQLQIYNELQENGRLAMNLLLQDLRQTGFFGDMTGQPLRLDGNVKSRLKLTEAHDCRDERGEPGGSLPASGDNGILRPFLARHVDSRGVLNAELGCLKKVRLQPESDVLSLKREVGFPVGKLEISRNSQRIYLAANVRQALFFAGNDKAATDDLSTLSSAQIREFQHHVYYIQQLDNIPELRLIQLTDQMNAAYSLPLVQGVERLRVLVAVDESVPADGLADKYLPPEKITPAIWNTFAITGIQLFLLIRALEPSPGFLNQQTYQLGDQKLAPFNDGYQRLVLQSSVQFRNAAVGNVLH